MRDGSGKRGWPLIVSIIALTSSVALGGMDWNETATFCRWCYHDEGAVDPGFSGRLEMSLSSLDGMDVGLHFFFKQGQVEHGYAITDGQMEQNFCYDMHFTPSHADGDLTIFRNKHYLCTLDVEINGLSVTGSYAGVKKDDAEADPSSHTPLSGTISGSLRSWGQIESEASAVDKSKKWDCWSGPTTNVVAEPCGHEIVEDLNQLTPVWRSEAVLPCGAGNIGRIKDGIGDNIWTSPPHGGNATPLVSDGKIFQWYFEPSGDIFDSEMVRIWSTEGHEKWDKYSKETGGKTLFGYLEERYGSDAVESVKSKSAVSADDVVVCMDAATGKTKWKTVFEGKGSNWQSHKSGPDNLTGCVLDGKVFVIGSTLRLYALDAETGDPLWEKSIGRKHEELEEIKAAGLRDSRLYNAHQYSSP